jgi:hypothetical protein
MRAPVKDYRGMFFRFRLLEVLLKNDEKTRPEK